MSLGGSSTEYGKAKETQEGVSEEVLVYTKEGTSITREELCERALQELEAKRPGHRQYVLRKEATAAIAAHNCTNLCPFYVCQELGVDNIYVCTVSNKVHICGVNCLEAIDSGSEDGSLVCRLSGIVINATLLSADWGVTAYENSLAVGMPCDDAIARGVSVVHCMPIIASTASKGPSLADGVAMTKEVYSFLMCPRSSPPRVAYNTACINHALLSNKYKSLFSPSMTMLERTFVFINFVRQWAPSALLDEDVLTAHMDSVCPVVGRLYVAAATVPKGRKIRPSQCRPFCLSILYMAAGDRPLTTVTGIILLQQDPFLKLHIPKTPVLHGKFGIAPQTITKMQRAIRKLVEENGDHFTAKVLE